MRQGFFISSAGVRHVDDFTKSGIDAALTANDADESGRTHLTEAKARTDHCIEQSPVSKATVGRARSESIQAVFVS